MKNGLKKRHKGQLQVIKNVLEGFQKDLLLMMDEVGVCEERVLLKVCKEELEGAVVLIEDIP